MNKIKWIIECYSPLLSNQRDNSSLSQAFAVNIHYFNFQISTIHYGSRDGLLSSWGAQLGNLKWAHLLGTLIDGWKGLWRWKISLYGSSVKGIWRNGSLARDPEGVAEKALEIGISFHRGHTGEPGRGSSARDFQRWMKGALGMGRFSLIKAQCGGPQGRVPLLGTLGYKRKALGMGISLHGGSVGQPEVSSSTENFERWLKGALEVGHLSQWELCEGNLEGGLPCWGPWKTGRKGSRDRHLFP
jgi:hypothetical protein